jgi:hypothetical protein
MMEISFIFHSVLHHILQCMNELAKGQAELKAAVATFYEEWQQHVNGITKSELTVWVGVEAINLYYKIAKVEQ